MYFSHFAAGIIDGTNINVRVSIMMMGEAAAGHMTHVCVSDDEIYRRVTQHGYNSKKKKEEDVPIYVDTPHLCLFYYGGKYFSFYVDICLYKLTGDRNSFTF